jgi:hypothetical protein
MFLYLAAASARIELNHVLINIKDTLNLNKNKHQPTNMSVFNKLGTNSTY